MMDSNKLVAKVVEVREVEVVGINLLLWKDTVLKLRVHPKRRRVPDWKEEVEGQKNLIDNGEWDDW
jgi:hypothetical protein